jgi:NO-binding membrane sensor protein with MHYT domain
MHFVGMLAFHLPIPVVYDLPITLLSVVFGIVVSGVAMFTLHRPVLSTPNLTMGATLLAVGICAMHYTGMIAMRMSPPIQFDPPLFIAPVLIAISSCLAALWIAFRLRKKMLRAGNRGQARQRDRDGNGGRRHAIRRHGGGAVRPGQHLPGCRVAAASATIHLQ